MDQRTLPAPRLGAIMFRDRPALVVGLENGQIILVHDQ